MVSTSFIFLLLSLLVQQIQLSQSHNYGLLLKQHFLLFQRIIRVFLHSCISNPLDLHHFCVDQGSKSDVVSLCNYRLGHPSLFIVRSILNKYNVSLSSNSNSVRHVQ